MEITYEIIKYAVRHNLLTPESKRELQEAGLFPFDDVCNEDADTERHRGRNEKELDRFEDELDRTCYGEYYHPRKRYGKGHNGKWKSSPDGPELKVKELNQLVQEEWNKLVEEFPRSLAIWDSWKAGKLKRVLADGFTLNDIYALMDIEFRDYHDLPGPESTAYRQLLRQVGNTVGKYSWVIKRPEMVSMVEFHRFRQKVLEEVRTLYETDRGRFALLSSQNGKLNFPFWEKAVHIDMTSMKVWTLLNLSSKPFTPEEIESIPKTWKSELAIALQLNLDYITELLEKLEKRDWSSFTVITEHKIENTIIKSLIIPEGIMEIGNEAFYGCTSLTSVEFPQSLEVIGERAFLGCSSLTSVELPDSVTTIRHGAFSGCRSLTSVTVPLSVTEFGKGPFYNCAGPGKVLLSQDGRFLLNVNIDFSGKFVIPETVKVILPNAFHACRGITSIVIPQDLKEIKPCAFCDCAAPGKAILSEDGRILLNVNKNISSNFDIPESVRVIAPNAFCKCSSLKSVLIHENVTEIGNEAFMECQELTIYASSPSYAEEYAFVYDIRFQPIEEEK